MNKILSIIIPTYNSNDNLSTLVNKLLQIDNIEVIVVDDCGCQNVFDIFFENSRLKLIRLPSNSGAGIARNRGLKAATGRFTCFFDADDDVFVDELSKIVKLLDDYSFDVVFFPPISHDQTGKLSKRHMSYQRLVDDYLNKGSEEILYKYHVPWSKIYRTQFLFENQLEFEPVSASNDVMFSLKSSMAAKSINVIDKTFYSVLSHSGSLTRLDTIQRLRDRIFVAYRYNRLLKSLGKYHFRTCVTPLFFRLLKLDINVLMFTLREYKLTSNYLDFFPTFGMLYRKIIKK
ncbi:glycosyltransferase [Vibrio diazotrophicus]|uniref:glycosyltransferase n=1 Tax=Vibrio diazotrophicus TaxID=685 RepID=UPI00142E5127|nr:glycosyltransferase [Vibrio diazotrophicus]NIY92602.1 glycosyltransferase [Vibrio diazotrophicus]